MVYSYAAFYIMYFIYDTLPYDVLHPLIQHTYYSKVGIMFKIAWQMHAYICGLCVLHVIIVHITSLMFANNYLLQATLPPSLSSVKEPLSKIQNTNMYKNIIHIPCMFHMYDTNC